MKEFLAKLQHLPYDTRRKILWISAIVLGIALLVLFNVFFHIASFPPINIGNTELATSVKQGTQEMQQQISDIQKSASRQSSPLLQNLPPDYRAVSISAFSTQDQEAKLIITFQVSNPSFDILDMEFSSANGVTLTAGETVLHPLSYSASDQTPFPAKILSKQTVEGQLVFPKPQSSPAKLTFSKLVFESRPGLPFDETLSIDLAKATPQVKGVVLPRE